MNKEKISVHEAMEYFKKELSCIPGVISIFAGDAAQEKIAGEAAGFSHEDAYVRDGNTIKVIAIYNKPDDFPKGYIARLFNGIEPTDKTVTGETLEAVRKKVPKGYMRIPRDKRDVGSLVESWIY